MRVLILNKFSCLCNPKSGLIVWRHLSSAVASAAELRLSASARACLRVEISKWRLRARWNIFSWNAWDGDFRPMVRWTRSDLHQQTECQSPSIVGQPGKLRLRPVLSPQVSLSPSTDHIGYCYGCLCPVRTFPMRKFDRILSFNSTLVHFGCAFFFLKSNSLLF